MNTSTRISIAVALAVGASAAAAQTSTTSTNTSTSTTTSSTSNATSSSTVTSATISSTGAIRSEPDFMARIGPRFERLAGSRTNLESLVHGLRTGSQVTLMEAGRTRTETVSFTPPLKRMSYRDITQALELAEQQLETLGIQNPTPRQLNAVLNGGTLTTAYGETTTSGILEMRSRGASWGRIAHLVATRPAMGRNPAAATGTTSATGTGVTAGGASVTFGPDGMRVRAGDAAVNTER